jgi:SH3-like domain-containing protein
MQGMQWSGLIGVVLAGLCLVLPATTPALAQAQTQAQAATGVGASTGFAIPRFVSIKASSANVRRGPSTTHRVDWVFRHPGLPVIVTAEYGHWRRVVDRDGLGGWVHYALLSGNRTVIIDVDMTELRRKPDRNTPVLARLERGVIARLGDCANGWCELSTGGHKGWAESAALWGVELRNAPAPAE